MRSLCGILSSDNTCCSFDIDIGEIHRIVLLEAFSIVVDFEKIVFGKTWEKTFKKTARVLNFVRIVGICHSE